MRKLYDFVRGVAELEVSGAQPERILNYCAENGIEFWNASPCRDFSITFAYMHPMPIACLPGAAKTDLT